MGLLVSSRAALSNVDKDIMTPTDDGVLVVDVGASRTRLQVRGRLVGPADDAAPVTRAVHSVDAFLAAVEETLAAKGHIHTFVGGFAGAVAPSRA